MKTRPVSRAQNALPTTYQCATVPLPRQATGRCGIGVTIRTFRWSDLSSLASLQSAIGGGDAPISPEDLRLWLQIPTVLPEENCFLAAEDDALLGHLLLYPEIPIDNLAFNVGVLPKHRRGGIGRALMEKAFERGRELGVSTIQGSVKESAAPEQRFLEALGFNFVRRYQRMRRGPQPCPAPSLAPGVELGHLEDGDHETLSRVQNASFASHFGFSPNAPDDIEHRLHLPGTSPEDVVVARKDGQVVAYCWTMMAGGKDGPSGEIWMTGVLPEYQGLGLGRAVVRAGLRHMLEQQVRHIELEVDEANASARRLYLTEGFQGLHAIVWGQRRLTG